MIPGQVKHRIGRWDVIVQHDPDTGEWDILHVINEPHHAGVRWEMKGDPNNPQTFATADEAFGYVAFHLKRANAI